MGILDDLLKKAPQSVKDKYKIKIREKAIERVKEKMIKHNKKVEDNIYDILQEKGGYYEMSKIWFEDRPLLRFHDPLAAVAIFDPSVCDYTTGTITVKRSEGRSDGVTRWHSGNPGSHRIASQVDVDKFFKSYFSVFD